MVSEGSVHAHLGREHQGGWECVAEDIFPFVVGMK
jgi:hypothetical protein